MWFGLIAFISLSSVSLVVSQPLLDESEGLQDQSTTAEASVYARVDVESASAGQYGPAPVPQSDYALAPAPTSSQYTAAPAKQQSQYDAVHMPL